MPQKQTPSGYLCVAGAANIDIIGTVNWSSPGNNHRGDVSLAFGGCAYNMAVNLGKLGAQVTFLTAHNDGPFAQMLLGDIKKMGIRSFVKTVPSLPDPVFCGIFHKGHAESTLLSESVCFYDFPKTDIKKVLRHAAALAITTELSPATLRHMVAEANSRQLPVYIAGCSENEVLRLEQITGDVTAVFLNEAEMDSYATHLVGTSNWQQAAQHKNTTFVVTQGEKGVTVCTPNSSTFIPAEVQDVTGTTLGAGDLLMSCTVYFAVEKGETLTQAVRHTFHYIKELLHQPHANLGGGNMMREHMGAIYTEAHRDKLTGLLNRHGLENHLTQVPDSERSRLFVLLLDIDFFKKINDTYGHAAGDDVLAQVARVIKENIRQRDVAARWGGEEFICLLQANAANALQTASRVVAAVAAAPFDSVGGKQVTISAGLAKINPKEPFSVALQQADNALYQAKLAGKNRVEQA